MEALERVFWVRMAVRKQQEKSKKAQWPATSTRETGAVVRLAKCCNHFAFDKAAAVSTFGPETILVIPGAVIITILAKESTLGQRWLADAAFKATDVEVLVLDPEYLAGALLLATLA